MSSASTRSQLALNRCPSYSYRNDEHGSRAITVTPIKQAYRSPLTSTPYAATPPQSPPPTSPLPAPPSSPTRTKLRPPVQSRSSRPRSSLPELNYEYLIPQDCQKRVNLGRTKCHLTRIQSIRRLHGQVRSSSDSDLPGSKTFLDYAGTYYSGNAEAVPQSAWILSAPVSRPEERVLHLRERGSVPDWPLKTDIGMDYPGTRRNLNPPKRAVARSALYIPSTANPQNQPATMSPKSTIAESLTEDVGHEITSLPIWRSFDSIEESKRPWSHSWQHEQKGVHERSGDVISAVMPSNHRRSLSSSMQSRADVHHQVTFSLSSVTDTVSDLEAQPRPQQQLHQKPPERTEASAKPPVRSAFSAETKSTTAPERDLKSKSMPWYIRRSRYLWMLFTVIVVLLAAAGVCGGFLWKLSRIQG